VSKKNVSVKLDEAIVETLDAEADEKGVTRSDHLREIVRQRHATEAVTEQLRDEQQQVEEKYKAKLKKKEQRIAELEKGIDIVHEQAEKAAREALQNSDEGVDKITYDLLEELFEEMERRQQERHQETREQMQIGGRGLQKIDQIQATLERNFKNIDKGQKTIVRIVTDIRDNDDGLL
jgi:uncharacterized protein with von Willebrand factor type A (vWA) domain